MAVWDALAACRCKILHICDYEGAHHNLSLFRDYPLAADCTVPADTSWDNLKAAVEVAHGA